MSYFYLLCLTVQAQGLQTAAAACGNWLMSHPVTALLSGGCLDSWSQLEESWLNPLAWGAQRQGEGN